MSNFTELVDWCKPVGGIDYRTTKVLTYDIGCVGSGVVLSVPVGEVFNVSIPIGLRWLLSPHDPRYLKAAALHDYALHKCGWSRTEAAAPFERALAVSGVGATERLIMTLSVIVWNWK